MLLTVRVLDDSQLLMLRSNSARVSGITEK
jgi:hypothetical protein